MSKSYLAIEASTSICTIALGNHEKNFELTFDSPRNHLENIYNNFDLLLEKSGVNLDDIHGIIVSKGPGSFTGLRVALGFAQGLATSLDVNICSLSSLQMIAYVSLKNHTQSTRCSIIVDARKNKFYLGKYESSIQGVKLLTEEGCIHKEDLQEATKNDCIVMCDETLSSILKGSVAFVNPTAKDYLSYVLNGLDVTWCAPENVSLNYIRQDVAN